MSWVKEVAFRELNRKSNRSSSVELLWSSFFRWSTAWILAVIWVIHSETFRVTIVMQWATYRPRVTLVDRSSAKLISWVTSNGCSGGSLQTAAAASFLVRFSKIKYPRLDNKDRFNDTLFVKIRWDSGNLNFIGRRPPIFDWPVDAIGNRKEDYAWGQLLEVINTTEKICRSQSTNQYCICSAHAQTDLCFTICRFSQVKHLESPIPIRALDAWTHGVLDTQRTRPFYAVTRSFMHRVKSSNSKKIELFLFDDFTLCMKLRVTA